MALRIGVFLLLQGATFVFIILKRGIFVFCFLGGSRISYLVIKIGCILVFQYPLSLLLHF